MIALPHADSPTFDTAAIRSYVELLHSRAEGVNGLFVVSVFYNDVDGGTITHHRPGDVAGMVAAISAHSETPHANVYCGLQLMWPSLGRKERGCERDIVAVLGIAADLDSDTGKTGDMPVEPSFIIQTSPGNSQPVILFDSPVPPQMAKELASGLSAATGGDTGTKDITHVWRVPGTLNYPGETKRKRGRSPDPVPVLMLQPFQGLLHSKDTLAGVLGPHIKAAKELKPVSFSGKVDTGPLLDRLSDKARGLLTADVEKGGRSEHAASVVEQLGFEGFTLEEAVSLCIENGGSWTNKYKTESTLIGDVERVWAKIVVPKRDAKAENAAAAAAMLGKAANDNYTPLQTTAVQHVPVKATPYIWKPPQDVPLRQFIYGKHLIRGYITTDVAPGGVGKSTQIITDALAMTTGRALLGDEPSNKLRVWIWNGEDPREEIERRISAACGHYKISSDDIGGRLFVDSGREQEIVIVTEDRNKIVYASPIIESLKRTILENKIDVFIVDPFVTTHGVPENDNTKIAAVAKQWAQIADECNCAVQIVHHVRKGDGREITVEDMRGAGALSAAARCVRLLNPMSVDEETAANLKRGERFSYFRVSNGKSNLTKRSEHSEWRELASFAMGNNKKPFEPQDHVGVVKRWEWPSAESLVADLPNGSLAAIKERLRGGDYKEHKLSTAWAGLVVGEILGIDTSIKAEARRVESMIRAWIESGELKVITKKDPIKRENKKYIEVVDSTAPVELNRGGAD